MNRASFSYSSTLTSPVWRPSRGTKRSPYHVAVPSDRSVTSYIGQVPKHGPRRNVIDVNWSRYSSTAPSLVGRDVRAPAAFGLVPGFPHPGPARPNGRLGLTDGNDEITCRNRLRGKHP